MINYVTSHSRSLSLVLKFLLKVIRPSNFDTYRLLHTVSTQRGSLNMGQHHFSIETLKKKDTNKTIEVI